MPRIQSISSIRNEEDIVESFVRHHAPIIELFRITLHRSTDDTKRILERLRAEGISIELHQSDADGFPQPEISTQHLKAAAKESPDFIFFLDADEFLSGADVRRSLESISRDAITLLPWKTYIPGASPLPTERRSVEDPQYYKLLIPGALAPFVTAVERGSHSFISDPPLATHISRVLHLSHIPIRTEAQMRNKIIQNWESHLRIPHRKAGENYHWERLYGRCKDPEPFTQEELRHCAIMYASYSEESRALVHDPISTPL